MLAIILEIGWVGFGLAGGELPGIRLGFARLRFTRGFLADALARAVADHRANLDGKG